MPTILLRSRALLTVQHVATRLGVSDKTVRRLIASEALTAHRIGRGLRISEDHLEIFLAVRRRRGQGV